MDYTYSDLVRDLNIGHEIEFLYMDQRYSISNNKFGWYLSRFGDDGDQAFDNVGELLVSARINEKPLEELWENVHVEVVF